MVDLMLLMQCIIYKYNVCTEWKVSKYRVIYGPYFSVFSMNAGKHGPEITPQWWSCKCRAVWFSSKQT